MEHSDCLLLSLNWTDDASKCVKPIECLSSWSLTLQCWKGKPLADVVSFCGFCVCVCVFQVNHLPHFSFMEKHNLTPNLQLFKPFTSVQSDLLAPRISLEISRLALRLWMYKIHTFCLMNACKCVVKDNKLICLSEAQALAENIK